MQRLALESPLSIEGFDVNVVAMEATAAFFRNSRRVDLLFMMHPYCIKSNLFLNQLFCPK